MEIRNDENKLFTSLLLYCGFISLRIRGSIECCRASCLFGSQLETRVTVVGNAGAALLPQLTQADTAAEGVDLQIL